MNRWRWALAIPVLAGYLAPSVLDDYPLSQLNRLIALALLAAGVAILTSYCGLASLGQVAPFAIGAYTTFQLGEAGITIGPVQLLVVAAGCAGFSAVTGLFVLRTRGVVFLMVTLAIGMLVTEIAGQWTSVTGGTDGTGLIEAVLPWWGAEKLVDDGDIYYYVLSVGLLTALLVRTLLRGTGGTVLRGIRDNETRARAAGHRVFGRLLAAYLLAGVVAGIGGCLYATGQRFVSPADAGFDVAAVTLLAVMIGGMHSIGGAVAGVAAVMAVRYWLAPEGQSDLWLGVLFVAAVYLLPNGFTGRFDRTGRPRT